MKKPEINNVEVDMVPLIDIISLLLMFLIIVGDTTASSNIASLRLPTADQAKTEKEWGLSTDGRIVIQIKPEFEDEKEQAAKNGKYFVIFNAAKHGNDDEGKSLKDHLAKFIDDAAAHGNGKIVKDSKTGTWNIPVKLRIPGSCPMVEAEKVLYTVASLALSDIQYGAAESKK
ncbi:MAG: biopolymer transporter ExbD [Planctomycetota bacterium]